MAVMARTERRSRPDHVPALPPPLPTFVLSPRSESRTPPKDVLSSSRVPMWPTSPPPPPGALPLSPHSRDAQKRHDSPMSIPEARVDGVRSPDEGSAAGGVEERMPNRDASANPLIPGDTTFTFSWGGPFFRLLKGVVEAREKCVDKRIKLDIGEDNFRSQARNTTARLDSFMDAAVSFMESMSVFVPPDRKREVDQRFADLQESAAHLRKWADTGKSQLRELNRWETWLSVEEEKVYNEFRGAIYGPGLPIEEDEESVATLNFEPLSTSSTSTNPLKHEYYDALGDMRLIQERIFNADAEQKRRDYQKEMAIRTGEYRASEKERDRYEEYVMTRVRMVEEFIELKQKMEKLQGDCKENGVKIEVPSAPPFLDLSQRPERPSGKAHRRGVLSDDWNPDMWLIYRGHDKRRQIMNWIDSVEATLKNNRSRSPGRQRAPPPAIVLKKNMPKDASSPPLAPPPLPPGVVPMIAENEIDMGDEDSDQDSTLEEPLPFTSKKTKNGKKAFFYRDRRVVQNPPARRFSESNLKRAHETKRFHELLTHQALEELTSTRSENGLDTLGPETFKLQVGRRRPPKGARPIISRENSLQS